MAQSLAETWRPVEGTDVRDTECPYSKESKEMQYKLFPPERNLDQLSRWHHRLQHYSRA